MATLNSFDAKRWKRPTRSQWAYRLHPKESPMAKPGWMGSTGITDAGDPPEDDDLCDTCWHRDLYHFDDGYADIVCRWVPECPCFHRIESLAPKPGDEQ